MMKSRIQFWSLLRPAMWSLALALLFGTLNAGVAQDQSSLTFAEDIAPILYENCAGCHQPNGIGPMNLLSYEDVRPYASRIKWKVETRQMPPWHLDKTIGIQEYKNDISLSDSEIHAIVSWVDAGAPEGDPTKLPMLPELPDGSRWQLEELLGPPDFVIESPSLDVAANGQDQWQVKSTPFEGIIDGPRYVRATELKGSYPLGVKVLHHGHVTLGGRPLGRLGVGKAGDVFPENTGMLIDPSGDLRWNLHYFPIDEDVADESATAAVWLYPDGYEPEYTTNGEIRFTADAGGGMPWAGDIFIPPHSIKAQQGTHVLNRAALISSFRPHMHMRGREQSLEAIYPDGRREMLAKVDNYNHFWQIAYEFEDHVAPLLPKGTVLLITTVWDNTADNPINPDPRQWVVFGQRGVDEMSHVWLGMTYLTEEQFETLSAERTRLVEQDGG
jgi:mono/diheme cytochrome c family protein